MRPRIAAAVMAAAACLALPVADVSAQRDTSRTGRGGEQRSDGPDRQDWTRTVERTAEGGFRMGDPDAPVKVIEYISLTCPECADFTDRAGRRLFQDYVRTGRASIEYRNFTLNGFDLAAAFLSRCAEPERYFDLTHDLLGNQPQWMGRMQALTEAQRNELRGLPQLEAMQRIVAWLGIDRIAARHGISAQAQRTCLADQAALDRIGAMMQTAQAQGVAQPPAFIVNGQRAEESDWPGLERLIRGTR